MIICESTSGQQTHQTEVRRDVMGSPVWNEATTFNDVASSDIIVIRLFDQRKFRMGGDVCLGQVCTVCHAFARSLPRPGFISSTRQAHALPNPPPAPPHLTPDGTTLPACPLCR